MTLSKKLSLLGAAALMAIGVGATLSYTKASKSVVETSATSADGDMTTIVIADNDWGFRTLWLDNFSYASGYNQALRNDYFDSAFGDESESWDKGGTTLAHHYYGTGVNLCAGGSSGPYTFLIPAWMTDFTISVQRSKESPYDVTNGSLSDVYHYGKTNGQHWEELGSGLGKTVTFSNPTWLESENCGQLTGSISNTTNKSASFYIFRKYLTSSSSLRSDDYVQSYQYYLPAVGKTPIIEGFTTDLKWYEGTTYAGATTEFSTTSIVTTTSNINVVAKYTVKEYTLTYDRNKNNGVQATQTKYHGTNVNAYTPGTAPLNTADWNPSFAKRFKEWNTHYTGGGVTYLSGATISSNSSFYLYYIEDWLYFRYRVNDGNWINLIENDTGKPDTVQAQFAPSTAQALHLHGKLYFQYSTDNSNWNDLEGVTFEGNYDTTIGIELETLDTIFLKVTNNNTYVCYVPGISDRTILVCDTPDATEGIPYSMRGDGNTQTVTTEGVEIKKGQYLRRCYAGTAMETYLISSQASSAFENITGNAAVRCKVTGVYTVYNIEGSFNWKDIAVVRLNELSASFVSSLMSADLAATCDNGGNTSMSSLIATWGSSAESGIWLDYVEQPEVVQNMINGTTHECDNDANVNTLRTKYDYILSKYGTTQLYNFMGRSVTPLGANNPLSIMFDTSNGNSNATLIIVITIASLSVLGGYIFIRRRKATK